MRCCQCCGWCHWRDWCPFGDCEVLGNADHIDGVCNVVTDVGDKRMAEMMVRAVVIMVLIVLSSGIEPWVQCDQSLTMELARLLWC